MHQAVGLRMRSGRRPEQAHEVADELVLLSHDLIRRIGALEPGEPLQPGDFVLVVDRRPKLDRLPIRPDELAEQPPSEPDRAPVPLRIARGGSVWRIAVDQRIVDKGETGPVREAPSAAGIDAVAGITHVRRIGRVRGVRRIGRVCRHHSPPGLLRMTGAAAAVVLPGRPPRADRASVRAWIL